MLHPVRNFDKFLGMRYFTSLFSKRINYSTRTRCIRYIERPAFILIYLFQYRTASLRSICRATFRPREEKARRLITFIVSQNVKIYTYKNIQWTSTLQRVEAIDIVCDTDAVCDARGIGFPAKLSKFANCCPV